MKRLLSIIVGLSLLFCGCAVQTEPARPYVVTTVFPAYDFARRILGGSGQVELLIPLGGEAHGYEPTLQDMAAVKNCDLFIYNGGESDGFAEELLKACDLEKTNVIRLMDHVELLTAGESHHKHNHDHTREEADEHIWTTPKNALSIAKAIGDGLQRENEVEQSAWEDNLNRLLSDLQALQTEYEILKTPTQKPLLVADRFPFTYLAHEYNLTYHAAFSGCTSNTEVGLSAMGELLEEARTHQIQTVLHTEFSQGDLANRIAEAVNGKTAVWHSCHNVSRKDFEQGVTYVVLMTHNLKVLKEALEL